MSSTNMNFHQTMSRFYLTLTLCLIGILPSMSAAHEAKFSSPESDAGNAFRTVNTLVLPNGLSSEEGSISFWISPQGWQHGEGKWHFFFVMRDPAVESGPRLMLYKFPDDQLRLLWQESKEKFISLQAPVLFQDQHWHHIAFTWRQEKLSCQTALYFDGSLLKQQKQNQLFDSKLLGTELLLGEAYAWNPASTKGSAIKNLQVLDICLQPADIALAAAPQRTIFQSIAAIPEVENQFSALVLGSSSYRWSVSYLDGQKREIHQEHFGFRFTSAADKASTCNFSFTPPPLTLSCVFRLQDVDGSSENLTFSNPEVRAGLVLRQVPNLYWQGCWIWDDQPFKAGENRYLRYSFQIDETKNISSAFAQWLTDDSSELFLNGHRIGEVTSWARPKYSDDLSKHLRVGENVLAAKAFNNFGAAAFLAELTLNYPERCETIASTPSWKISSQEISGWEKPGFNDAGWSNAVCRVKLPRNPYGVVPYRYFGHQQAVKLLRYDAPLEVRGNGKQPITVEILCDGDKLTSQSAILGLYKNGIQISKRQLALVKIAHGRWQLSGQWQFPPDAESGVYEVRVDNSAWSFPDGNVAASINYQPAEKKQAASSRVAKIEGIPRLLINEKASPLITYKVNIDGRQDELKYLEDFYNAGVKIFEINLSLNRLWTAPGSVDFQQLNATINQYLFAAPRGYLHIGLSVYAPSWWLQNNPAEQTRFEHEGLPHYAYSSEKFRLESTAVLRQLLDYIEEQAYAKRIIGYFLSGGEDGQWMQWVKGGSGAMFSVADKRLSDYSRPMQKYFHAWLRKKYNNLDTLNQAWKQNHQDFADIALPSEAERKAVPGGFIYNPHQHQPVIDFQQALSDSITDLLLSYSQTIKKATGGRKTVGLYYGKLFTIGGHNEWSEFGFHRLLQESSIDYFSGPSYFQRQPGRPHSVSAPLAAIARHGKMFIDEADLRTYAGGAQSWAYTGNPWDTVHTMRKIVALNLVENQGVRWYDIHPGEFATSVIMDTVKQLSRSAEKSLESLPRKTEIAVVISEKSLTYSSMEVIDYMRKALRNQWDGLFYRIAAPVDFHLLEDFQQEDFPDYKLYVFLNAWHLDEAQRLAIKKRQKQGAVLLWFHAPGILSEKGLDSAQIEEVIGFKLQKLENPPKIMEIVAAELPFLQSLEPLQSGLGNINPLFAPIANPEITLFGKMGDYAAGAHRDFGLGGSIYIAAPLLSPELLRNIASFAGCHLYCDDPEAMLYIGSKIFALHCGSSGTRSISFPEEVQLREHNSGALLNDKASRKIAVPMQAGESKIFDIIR